MKHQITSCEIGRRMRRLAKVWFVSFALAAGMGWVAYLHDPGRCAMLFGATGVILLVVSLVSAKRIRQCLLDHPIDVTPSAVSVPIQYGSIWIPYDIVTAVELDMRRHHDPSLTLRASGTPRYRIRGYRDMSGLIEELKTLIPSKKWSVKGSNTASHGTLASSRP